MKVVCDGCVPQFRPESKRAGKKEGEGRMRSGTQTARRDWGMEMPKKGVATPTWPEMGKGERVHRIVGTRGIWEKDEGKFYTCSESHGF